MYLLLLLLYMCHFCWFIIIKIRTWTVKFNLLLVAKYNFYISYKNTDKIFSGCAPIHVAIEAHGKLNSKKTLIDSQFVIHQLADRGASLNKQACAYKYCLKNYFIVSQSFLNNNYLLYIFTENHLKQNVNDCWAVLSLGGTWNRRSRFWKL